MPRWPLRRRRGGLVLRSDDRSEFRETQGSGDLATQMLETARERAAKLASGADVVVDIPGGYSHVHNMEMMLSLTERAADYGLKVMHQFDNRVTFRKL